MKLKGVGSPPKSQLPHRPELCFGMAYKSVFDASAVKSEFVVSGINPNFIPIIWKHVLQNPNCKWDEIPSLPFAAYSLLHSKFKPSTSTLHTAVDSIDQVTTKLLIKLKNGEFVEAVIMRYDTRLGRYDGNPRPGGLRSTLCISSQVGCKMGCNFCATGTMGFKSNLSSGEILEQLVHASRIATIRNVVFMGMGEPLNNYSAVVEAIRVMTAPPFQLSPKKITVSTVHDILLLCYELFSSLVCSKLSHLFIETFCNAHKYGIRYAVIVLIHFKLVQVGIIHAISKLHKDIPNLNLAVSLHAPVQEIRCQIMPAARAFPLERLMNALRDYQASSQQKIFIEYIMLDGVNDEEQHAHQLGKLLETFEVVVNLIPFNPIGSLSRFKTSNDQKVTEFQIILRGTYNIRTTVRKQMGQDISGACGQLVVNLPGKMSSRSADHVTDIEDLHI